MIIPKLIGGLCNQMFQIAAGYSLSLKLGTTFAINYDLFQQGTQGSIPSTYRNTIYRNIASTTHTPKTYWHTPYWQYTPLPEIKSLFYSGYFQSEKYFLAHKEQVKKLFTFPETIINEVKSVTDKIKTPIVGIHVRGGDYNRLPSFHVKCDTSYYQKSINLLPYEKATYIICTDDPETATSRMSFLGEDFRLSNFTDELADLYFLTQCDSIIMCNSSFSWWGAYFGPQKDMIICPSTWFGPSGPNPHDDIYCDGWNKVSNN